MAEKLGARIIQVHFKGFGDLRNQAIAVCQYEWIFSLDSDERCTPEVRDEIVAIINSDQAVHIYKVPRKNYFLGRWIKYGGWYPDYRQPQLFRKGSLSYVEDIVHENYQCYSKKPIGYLKKPILQIPFENLSEMIAKMNRYSTLGVDRLKKRYTRSINVVSPHSYCLDLLKVYFLRRGFLDGWPGFIIAMGCSYNLFYRYAKFYEQEKLKQIDSIESIS